MTKTIKKVGIPTTLLRSAILNEEGEKVINAKFNGVDITLIQDKEYKFIFHQVINKKNTYAIIHYRNDIIYKSPVLFENVNVNYVDLWIDNKSLVKRIKSGEVDNVDIDAYNVDLINGLVLSKYEYMFISNENDFTLE